MRYYKCWCGRWHWYTKGNYHSSWELNLRIKELNCRHCGGSGRVLRSDEYEDWSEDCEYCLKTGIRPISLTELYDDE